MSEKVVCNASPLIFLAKIRKLELLDRYKLYIPSHVKAEIVKGLKRNKQDAQLILEYMSRNNIQTSKCALLKNLPAFLGSGEKAVISLAFKEGITKVFIDEAKARTVARFRGLVPKGTLGIIWDAYKMEALAKDTVESLVFDLIQKGYRIREEIIVEFLKRLKY